MNNNLNSEDNEFKIKMFEEDSNEITSGIFEDQNSDSEEVSKYIKRLYNFKKKKKPKKKS